MFTAKIAQALIYILHILGSLSGLLYCFYSVLFRWEYLRKKSKIDLFGWMALITLGCSLGFFLMEVCILAVYRAI